MRACMPQLIVTLDLDKCWLDEKRKDNCNARKSQIMPP
jgi:hypothetical protein